nr:MULTISPECIES: hypothetical protein [Sorangium]
MLLEQLHGGLAQLVRRHRRDLAASVARLREHGLLQVLPLGDAVLHRRPCEPLDERLRGLAALAGVGLHLQAPSLDAQEGAGDRLPALRAAAHPGPDQLLAAARDAACAVERHHELALVEDVEVNLRRDQRVAVVVHERREAGADPGVDEDGDERLAELGAQPREVLHQRIAQAGLDREDASVDLGLAGGALLHHARGDEIPGVDAPRPGPLADAHLAALEQVAQGDARTRRDADHLVEAHGAPASHLEISPLAIAQGREIGEIEGVAIPLEDVLGERQACAPLVEEEPELERNLDHLQERGVGPPGAEREVLAPEHFPGAVEVVGVNRVKELLKRGMTIRRRVRRAAAAAARETTLLVLAPAAARAGLVASDLGHRGAG